MMEQIAENVFLRRNTEIRRISKPLKSSIFPYSHCTFDQSRKFYKIPFADEENDQ